MKKYIFDESNGLWYELQGDYYIPCLTISESENYSIGISLSLEISYISHILFIYILLDF